MQLWLWAAGPLILVVYGVWIYNRFVRLNLRAENAFSDVDVQLKRRWDLVPSLVEVVRGYAGHEQETLQEVISTRGQVMSSQMEGTGPEQRGVQEAELATVLRGLFILTENYPALKADQNFLQLHETLVEVEDNIQYSRRYFNAVVRDFNTLRQSIPSSIVGAATGVQLLDFFQFQSHERSVPAIDLDINPEVKS